jgi:hypothetical protein
MRPVPRLKPTTLRLRSSKDGSSGYFRVGFGEAYDWVSKPARLAPIALRQQTSTSRRSAPPRPNQAERQLSATFSRSTGRIPPLQKL